MTQKRNLLFPAILLPIISACATVRPNIAAPAPDINRSSLCLIDKRLPIRAAPQGLTDDPGNLYDNDKSTDEKIAHNARLDAACPDMK